MLQLIWPYFGHELCSFFSPFFGGLISKWIWAEMGKTSKWAAAYDIFQKRSRNRTNGLEGKPTLALIIYWIFPKKIQKKPKKWSFDNLDNCWRVLRKTFERNFVSIEVTSTIPFLLYYSINTWGKMWEFSSEWRKVWFQQCLKITCNMANCFRFIRKPLAVLWCHNIR